MTCTGDPHGFREPFAEGPLSSLKQWRGAQNRGLSDNGTDSVIPVTSPESPTTPDRLARPALERAPGGPDLGARAAGQEHGCWFTLSPHSGGHTCSRLGGVSPSGVDSRSAVRPSAGRGTPTRDCCLPATDACHPQPRFTAAWTPRPKPGQLPRLRVFGGTQSPQTPFQINHRDTEATRDGGQRAGAYRSTRGTWGASAC